MEEKKEYIKLLIDGHEVEAPKGSTILQAARLSGKNYPPAMCYHSAVEKSGGKCRVCLVKVTRCSETNERAIPKLVPSCLTRAEHGMIVENESSQEVMKARKGVVEFLLLNHPLDCPVCDQAGECDLQDLSFEHGEEETRYQFERREFEKRDIGDFIQLHMTRCILCYRCVYTAEQLTEERVHGVLNRGDISEISTYIEKAINNEFSGNIIDVCPVGALTDKTYRFKQRVWFSKPFEAKRDCPTCSGKVRLWKKGEDVIRVTARKDEFGEVHDFICNDCRYHHKKTEDWEIIGVADVGKDSVISQNKYELPVVSPAVIYTVKDISE